METHTQFCHSGDQTFEATRRAIDAVARREADERFVFVISDADLARYRLDPKDWCDDEGERFTILVFVVSCVVLFLSCCCVCNLFLLLHVYPRETYTS